MSTPVDLSNLREMIGNDAELEQALIKEFHHEFAAGIAQLNGALETVKSEDWRRQAHALKGMALNLGAAPLGELCKQAQDAFQQDMQAKQQLLAQIEAEWRRVRDYLVNP